MFINIEAFNLIFQSCSWDSELRGSAVWAGYLAMSLG